MRKLVPLLVLSTIGFAVSAAPDTIRVCADPFSLPSSNKERMGYENAIAELFAESLGTEVEYTWFPQRIGFIRNTLRNNETEDGSYKCDLVMGVPENFELAATTVPYMRSTWALVFVEGTGFDDVRTASDLANLPSERLEGVRIGSFDKGPATDWIFQNGLIEYLRPFQIMAGDARSYPGQMIDTSLVNGDIQFAFAWGPIAGYFAKKVEEETGKKLRVIPMRSTPLIKFDYQISMAVRFGEGERKQAVNELITAHQEDIDAILTDYGVPLLPVIEREVEDDDD